MSKETIEFLISVLSGVAIKLDAPTAEILIAKKAYDELHAELKKVTTCDSESLSSTEAPLKA